METRHPFYRSISTFWNIFGGLCTQVFYSLAWVRSDLKSFVSSYNHSQNIKPEVFKFKMGKISQKDSLKPNTN